VEDGRPSTSVRRKSRPGVGGRSVFFVIEAEAVEDVVAWRSVDGRFVFDGAEARIRRWRRRLCRLWMPPPGHPDAEGPLMVVVGGPSLDFFPSPPRFRPWGCVPKFPPPQDNEWCLQASRAVFKSVSKGPRWDRRCRRKCFLRLGFDVLSWMIPWLAGAGCQSWIENGRRVSRRAAGAIKVLAGRGHVSP